MPFRSNSEIFLTCPAAISRYFLSGHRHYRLLSGSGCASPEPDALEGGTLLLLTVEVLDQYCALRLGEKVSPATINRESACKMMG